MAATSISVRAPQSKFAAEENLWVEIKDNHPGMLRSFVENAKSIPDVSDYEYVQNEVNNLRILTSELSGLKNIVIMTVLENTSVVFIPYLAELSKKLNSSDQQYTDVHGEADAKHANQFLEALSEEQHMEYKDSTAQIDKAISTTLGLLKNIFV